MIATSVFRRFFILPIVVALLVISALAWQSGRTAASEPDSTPPAISSIAVTSDPRDDVGITIPYRVLTSGIGYVRFDIYAAGDIIQLTVNFDKPVNVTGTPQLQFVMGSSTKTASFNSVQGNSLTFHYPVVNGDKDTNGISVRANSLVLNRGTIQGESGNDANLTHDALPAQRGHKVDGIPPRITSLSIQDGEGVPIEVLGIGDQVRVPIRFSERVYASIAGPPQIRLQVGDAERKATWLSEAWGRSFIYYIQEGDLDPDGISINANSIDLNGGTIQDDAGNPLILSHAATDYGSKRIKRNEGGTIEVFGPVDVDGIRPVVESLTITSDPGSDKTYLPGDVVKVSVRFSEPMTVPELRVTTPGRETFTSIPSISLNIGGTERRAAFESVDGHNVTFAYTIQDEDQDSDGISIGANKLTVKHEDAELQAPIFDAAIRDRPDTAHGVNDANLSHAALADDTSHLVGEAGDGQGGTEPQPQKQQQQAPPNQAPTVSGAITDATIVNESGTKQISLSGVFSDADNDALTVTAASSDDAKATVSVASDQSSLMVTAQARGTAAITATANDGNGGTVSDTFSVTVKAAPVVALAVADLSLEEGATREVSLSGVFSDADGDALTIVAAPSDDAKATLTVAADQSKLTVAGVAEGTVSITVAAQDSDGNGVSDTFDVTVSAPQPQEQAQPPGPVVNLELAAMKDSVTVSWQAPESGGAPDRYIVHLKAKDGGKGETKRPGAKKTAVTFRNLDSGTTYRVWVRAQNEDGKGERNHASITLPVEAPGPVTSLQLSATTDSVNVSWQAPETGSAPDGYIVHLRPEGGKQGSGTTKTPKAKKTKVTFENLKAGRVYKVWVRAQNEAGKGERVHATIGLPEAEPPPEEGDSEQSG